MTDVPAPLISIVVPCYRADNTLPLLLESLSTQIDAPAFEVILVDNGENWGLEEIVSATRGKLACIRAVKAHEEQGASYARNVGAAHARGTALFFCDADDVVSAHWVAYGQRVLEAAQVWTGSAVPVPEEGFGTKLTDIRRKIGDPVAWEEPTEAPPGAFPVLMGGNFGIVKVLFEDLGGFDQSLPSAGEDNELAVRLRLRGIPLLHAPAVKIAYRISLESRSRRRAQYAGARAHALIASRYGLWKSSPYPPALVLLSRVLLSACRMILKPRHADWGGLSQRLASACGLLEGEARYRLLKRVPPQRLRAGFDEAGRHG